MSTHMADFQGSGTRDDDVRRHKGEKYRLAQQCFHITFELGRPSERFSKLYSEPESNRIFGCSHVRHCEHGRGPVTDWTNGVLPTGYLPFQRRLLAVSICFVCQTDSS